MRILREIGNFNVTIVARHWSDVATVIVEEAEPVHRGEGRRGVTSILMQDLIDGRIPDPLPPMDQNHLRACEWAWAVSIASAAHARAECGR